MSSVSSVNNNSSSLASALSSVTGSGSQFVSENTFLTLLITQLENQGSLESPGFKPIRLTIGFVFCFGTDDGDEYNFADRFGQFINQLDRPKRDGLGFFRQSSPGNSPGDCVLLQHASGSGKWDKLSTVGYPECG